MKSLRIVLIYLACSFVMIYPVNSKDDKSAFNFVVSKDNSGDFHTVQEAINAVPDFT